MPAPLKGVIEPNGLVIQGAGTQTDPLAFGLSGVNLRRFGENANTTVVLELLDPLPGFEPIAVRCEPSTMCARLSGSLSTKLEICGTTGVITL
jgi:hypothetical protein